MSWKNIKTFLILLFTIINIYLIFSTNGFVFKKQNVTYIDKTTIDNTINIIKNNYNITVDESIIPKSVDNLRNIDVTNIIYTDKFKNSRFSFKTAGNLFETTVKTGTFSYNELNAEAQLKDILKNLGIDETSYTIDTYKTDEGLVCIANESFSQYKIFNSRIKAAFLPSEVNIQGAWYLPQSKDTKDIKSSTNMTDITSIIIDTAEKCANSDGTEVRITNIEFGYYVSSYDENAVSKSSSAIPCYMLSTDDGSKYYYDALNGKSIKQED